MRQKPWRRDPIRCSLVMLRSRVTRSGGAFVAAPPIGSAWKPDTASLGKWMVNLPTPEASSTNPATANEPFHRNARDDCPVNNVLEGLTVYMETGA